MSSLVIRYRGNNGAVEEFSTASDATMVITAADGIYDFDNTVHTIAQYGQDGSSYIGGKLSPKRIALTIQVMTDVVANRTRLAESLNPKTQGTFELIRGDTVRNIRGIVEKFSVNTTDGSIVNIVALCPNPFWREMKESRADIAAWMKEFCYPLTVEKETGFVFGKRLEQRVINVHNKGAVTVGMRVVFTASAEVVNPAIVNARKDDQYIRIMGTLNAGDMLTITTGKGEKSVALTRAGKPEENAFHLLEPNSTFLQLAPGENLLRYEAKSGEMSLTTTIFYFPGYLGV